MTPPQPGEPSLLTTNDWAVLALLAEAPAHGFRVASAFARGSELSLVWRIHRPQVYRALRRLTEHGFVRPVREEGGEAGPPRLLYAPTPEGRAALAAWLTAPVARVREGRTDLLLKLTFLARRGGDPRPLLRAQRARFAETRRRYETERARSSGTLALVYAWRLEAAEAALRFLDGLLAECGG